jgi:hypothetical protein
VRAGRIVLLLVGLLLVAMGVGVGAAGAVAGWTHVVHRDADGFVTTPTFTLGTDAYALTAEHLELVVTPDTWTSWQDRLELRLRVDPAGGESVFVGLAPRADVEAYLDGIAHDEVTQLRFRSGRTTTVPGDDVPEAPGDQTFWSASSEGPGTRTLDWTAETGEWAVVVMRADGTPGLEVAVDAGVQTGALGPLAIGLLLLALLLIGGGTAMIVAAVPGVDHEAAPPAGATLAAPRAGGSPVAVVGHLDDHLSRWQWLVKWLLLLPHVLVLVVLWAAFTVLTVVAGFAILFTGRYPRGIFDFNLGVLRWTWRVSFYGYSALGTDRYPPFSLADEDHPARLDIAYPARLSRGLVLVKWWLLALPHLLIVGLLTGGFATWTTQVSSDTSWQVSLGGGLIGLLVLVAAIALLFTGRYPEGLFDLVVGLNRWVYRVIAYVALMTDDYPPFRLDSGGDEPRDPSPPPPTAPTDTARHGSHPTPV